MHYRIVLIPIVALYVFTSTPREAKYNYLLHALQQTDTETRSFLYGAATGIFSDLVRRMIMLGVAYRLRNYYPFFAFLSIPSAYIGSQESCLHFFTSEEHASASVYACAGIYGILAGVLVDSHFALYATDILTTLDNNTQISALCKGYRYGRTGLSFMVALSILLSHYAEEPPSMFSYIAISGLAGCLSAIFLQRNKEVLASGKQKERNFFA